MEDYLSMLKERMQRDLKMLQYLKSPSYPKDDEAEVPVSELIKQVGHRILIMQKEIKGAEENS